MLVRGFRVRRFEVEQPSGYCEMRFALDIMTDSTTLVRPMSLGSVMDLAMELTGDQWSALRTALLAPEKWIEVQGGTLLYEREIALINSGQKVAAIKSFRDRTGVSLTEAVPLFQKWYRENGRVW